MKRHVTASAVSIGRQKEGGVPEAANGAHAAFNENTRPRGGSSKPNLVLASANVWTHTLVLTGDLDHRSAHTLELEIERLCEEGVSGITVDLRELEHVDPIGVAVIAFRCGLCKRRGYDFALIAGPPHIQRAFEQAGVSQLPFVDEEVAGSPARPTEVVAAPGSSRAVQRVADAAPKTRPIPVPR
jgi:anti-anti-sigma factor